MTREPRRVQAAIAEVITHTRAGTAARNRLVGVHHHRQVPRRPLYRVTDPVTLMVRAGTECHLTLLNTGPTGVAALELRGRPVTTRPVR